MCNRQGCPVAVEVFDGNTSDPMTTGAQIDKLRHRFGLERVGLVGDRGMLTEARIREEVEPAGLDWIGALRAPAIRKLVESGAVQMSLFDRTDLVEVNSDAYPGERLMVCRNPLLAAERARKRDDLLLATERLLDPIAAAVQRPQRPLTGQDKIALRAGKVIGTYKMAKHFDLEITDSSFRYRRKPDSIAAEAALDGLCVERAFRSFKTVDLKVRPIYHYAAHRTNELVWVSPGKLLSGPARYLSFPAADFWNVRRCRFWRDSTANSATTGRAVEYFTCFNAKLDLVCATPSMRASDFLKKRSYVETSVTTTFRR